MLFGRELSFCNENGMNTKWMKGYSIFIWISTINIFRDRPRLLWLLLCQILSYFRCTMSAASWLWSVHVIWKLRSQMMDFVSFPSSNQKLLSSSKEILSIQIVSRNPYCVKTSAPFLSVWEKQSIRKWAISICSLVFKAGSNVKLW